MPKELKPVAALCFGLLVFFAPLISGAGELRSYPHDSAAHTLQLSDLGGRIHNLADYRGEVVLINFWASWCMPCLTEMPGMQRLNNALKDRPFSILAVNFRESKSTVWKFRKLLGMEFTTLLDSNGESARTWGVNIYPTSYLVDPEGSIRYRVQGALEWDSEEVLKVIRALMGDAAADENPPARQVEAGAKSN